MPPPPLPEPDPPWLKGCRALIIGAVAVCALPFIMIAMIVGGSGLLSVLPLAGVAAIIWFLVFSNSAQARRRAAMSMATSMPASEPPPLPRSVPGVQGQRQSLFDSLPPPARERHARLMTRCQRLRDLAAAAHDTVTKESAGPAIEKLTWMHLKLLLAEAHLQSTDALTAASELQRQAEELRTELATGGISEAARHSREATLALIGERLRNVELRRQRLDEIDTDLERIEAQVDLSLERAALHSGQTGVQFQLDLASRDLASAEYFGAASPAVREVDRHYGYAMAVE